jgi:hypothetical protein
MTPCNACDQGKCGSCVGDRLESQGHIRDAKIHCGCAANGHKNDLKDTARVKSMFSKTKKEEEVHVERRIITEEEIEVD